MGLLITFAAVSIGVSFLCSIFEVVLLSITPSYIAGLRESQPDLYGKLRAFKDKINQPLAAILTLNTVAHTFGAAGVGAQVGVVFRSEMLDADPETQVEYLLKPVKIFTDDLSAEDALSTLLKEHQHLALIYDEYGTWLGLVTMEDILETILGTPIIDETDDIPNMRRHARRRWEHRLKNL
jgi:CBS domain containing-hemolysin-like protein